MIKSLSEITQLWDRALQKIEERLGEKQLFDSFFAGSYINEINNDEITVVVNSNLAVRLMSTRYNDIITDVIHELTESNFRMNYILPSDVKQTEAPIANVVKKQNYFKDAVLNTNLTFDNFVVGDFNREASQASLYVAANPGKTFAQPLFIYSNSGLGKTHLLQAIGNYVIKEVKPDARILYISASDFVEEYIRFVKGEKEAESLKDFFNSVDVLLIDDVQFLANKDKTQEMFFSVYNKLIDNNKQVVITSDKQPSELRGLEDRLVTRFSKGLTVKINEPDQNTCVEILKKKIVANGLDINNFDDSVLYFFAEKFSKDIRELEGALNRLMFYMISSKQTGRITMEVAIDAVQSLVGGKALSTQLSFHSLDG